MERFFDPRMAKAFLPIADRFVGYPLTIAEGMEVGMSASWGADWRIALPINMQLEWQSAYSNAFLLSLKTGETPSFVEVPSSGRWLRIPRQHWWASENLDQLEMVAGEWPGRDNDLQGATIVVWKADVETYFAKHLAAVDALHLKQSARAPSTGGDEQKRTVSSPAIQATAEAQFDRFSRYDDMVQWYSRHCAQAPAEGLSRLEDEKACRAVGIKRSLWRDLRREYAPDHWHKDGAKGKVAPPPGN